VVKNKFLGKYRIASSRLKDWNYSENGYYSITICAFQREEIFGEIINGKMILNKIGKIIEENWKQIPQIRKNIQLDKFVVMPNHLHGILIIENTENSHNAETPHLHVETPQWGVSTSIRHLKWKTSLIGIIINQFKGVCTKQIHAFNPSLKRIWQPRYHDRIIRDEEEYNRIQAYILTNAENWESDEENLRKQF
jgi:REP element-mobilizing transposase RayT